MITSFNKLPKIEETSSFKNESIKVHCNSKFYLPTDLDNTIDKQNLDQLELQKSKLKIIKFLSFNGLIVCDECNFKLRNQINEENSLNKLNETNLTNFKNDSLINYSICSLHNPPNYQNYETIDLTIQKRSTNLQEIDRQLLEESIVRLFINCNLMNGELQRLHLLVERLINSNNDLSNNYSCIINKGLHQLKIKILNNQLTDDILKEDQLIKVLIKIWKDFYSQILPIIECSFYNLKSPNIKQVTLKAFRDEIVLKLGNNLKDALIEHIKKKKKVPDEIKQMLLILNAIDQRVPSTKQQLELEKLCSICVSIFIGSKGLYVNGKLVVKSNEPLTNADKSLEFNFRKVRPHIAECNQIIEGYS